MSNPDDFMDLFATPAPKPAQAPAPVEEVKPSMFDGVLDEFEVQAEEDLEQVTTEVEAPEEAQPESEVDDPAIGYDWTVNAPMAMPLTFAVAEPEDRDRLLDAHRSVVERLVEHGEREPAQDRAEAVDHLVQDWHASPEPVEQRMVLVHSLEDRSAVLNALPATVPASAVRVVKPRRSRRPLWIGVAVAILAIGGAVAWIHTNKESAPTVVVEAPVQAPKVEAPPAPAPIVMAPPVIEPPKVETAVVVEPVPEPAKVEPVVMPDPVPVKSEPKPVAKKPAQKKPAPKPAQEAPAKTWQDDAMDKLDDLEKRL